MRTDFYKLELSEVKYMKQTQVDISRKTHVYEIQN